MCESLCDFVSQCGETAEDCSNLDTCVDNVEGLSGPCQSALKDFTDCWDEHPDCASADCADQAMAFTTECQDEL